jgi:hypothetical protein
LILVGAWPATLTSCNELHTNADIRSQPCALKMQGQMAAPWIFQGELV